MFVFYLCVCDHLVNVAFTMQNTMKQLLHVYNTFVKASHIAVINICLYKLGAVWVSLWSCHLQELFEYLFLIVMPWWPPHVLYEHSLPNINKFRTFEGGSHWDVDFGPGRGSVLTTMLWLPSMEQFIMSFVTVLCKLLCPRKYLGCTNSWDWSQNSGAP